MSTNSQTNAIQAINDPQNYVNDIIQRATAYKDYAQKYQSAMEKIEDDKDYQDKYRDLAIQLAEDKMNEVIDYKKSLQDELTNKKRMVKIQTYENKRYKAINNVIIMMTLTFIALIGNNFLKAVLPEFLSLGLFVIIVLVGGYLIATTLLDIFNRDHHDFDKYDFGDFNVEKHKQSEEAIALTNAALNKTSCDRN